MDWITLLINFVTVLLPMGGISAFLFYRQDKDKRIIENKYSIENAQREELSRKDSLLDKKDERIQYLENKLTKELREKEKLMNCNSSLLNAIIHATCFKCVDFACLNRKPPMKDIDKEMAELDAKYNTSNDE